jgi:hypothetical protein
MTNTFLRRRTRIIQHQEMDNCNKYNASTPQTRGTRRRKTREEEEQNAFRLNMFRVVSIWKETQQLKRGLHVIEIFSSPANATYILLIVTAMLMLDSKNSDLICYSNSILQVIASCTHLTDFFLSPPSKDHQRFRHYYKFATVIHSMITGRPDVVNPYNFVEIFKSYHKNFDANECTYIL